MLDLTSVGWDVSGGGGVERPAYLFRFSMSSFSGMLVFLSSELSKAAVEEFQLLISTAALSGKSAVPGEHAASPQSCEQGCS